MQVGSAMQIVICRIFDFKIEDLKKIYLEIRPSVVMIGSTGGKILNFNYF